MSENSKHINTDKKCKKQEKTPKYVGENLILKSGHKNKKEEEGPNVSENIDLVIIG